MCLIIKKDKEDALSLEFMDDVWRKNPDGWGITYNSPKTGEVMSDKGLSYTDFICKYFELEALDIDFVIHMRYATHGLVNRKNCHPFKVMDGMYLMHNGIFSIDMGKEKKLSDTRVFIRDVLRPLLDSVSDPFEFVQGYVFQHIMEFYCDGQDSRLVLHTKDGPLFFGTWKKTSKGVVVSNHYAFTIDNPTWKPLSSAVKDEYNWGWENYNRSRYDRTSEDSYTNSTTFYPSTKEEAIEDAEERYVQSLNDALDNFEVIAETYWALTPDEIEFVNTKLCEGEWCFEMDDFNPAASILWDEQGQIVRKENLPAYITLSKVQYAATAA